MTASTKDPKQFPMLRNLQFSPLKENEEQYIVLWDPSGLTAERLIVPLNYFYLMQFFDGEHSLDQMGALYLKQYGEFFMPDRLENLVADLDAKLFLEGVRVETAKQAAVTTYRQAPVRLPAHAGKSYEDDAAKLRRQIDGFFSSKEGPELKPSENKGKAIKGLVVPHYAPREAGPVYAWAYKELQDAIMPDLYIVLGTCHAGLEHGFAVTDKDFQTPLGTIPVDRDVMDRVRKKGGATFFDEDIAHRNEHTIEFQLPFLQHIVGSRKPFTMVPVLCAFPPMFLRDPQFSDVAQKVELFLKTLKEAITEAGKEACVVASAELAHIGMRYGDNKPPTDYSFHKCMQTDLEMLKHVENLDADAFAQFIRKEGDARRISGFAAIYTLLKLIEAEKGQVLRYDRGVTDQFNSTVTYASMAFF